MLIGQQIYKGFVYDERGDRYPIPFYMDEVQRVSKITHDNGEVRNYANVKTKGSMFRQLEIDSGTMKLLIAHGHGGHADTP